VVAESDDDLFREFDFLGKLDLYPASGFVDHNAVENILAGAQGEFRALMHRPAKMPAAVGISIERIGLGHRAAPSNEGALCPLGFKTA
jgi:hypothetical protein